MGPYGYRLCQVPGDHRSDRSASIWFCLVKQVWSDRDDSCALAGAEPYQRIERHEFVVVGGRAADERVLQSV
jgi:hypothetical protein